MIIYQIAANSLIVESSVLHALLQQAASHQRSKELPSLSTAQMELKGSWGAPKSVYKIEITVTEVE